MSVGLASGRKGASLLSRWETVGQVQAASFLPPPSDWLQRGDGSRAQKNRLRQLQLSSCLPPATDLSAAALIGSAGRCSWGFLPHKALLTPRQPLRLGHHPPHQPLAWHGMARWAAVPQGEGKSQPGLGPAGFIVLRGVRVLPWAGFP